MIKVLVMYPLSEEKRFDLEYYTAKHMPMVAELVGDACKKAEVTKGLSGPGPGMPPAFGIIASLYFDSLEDLQSAFMPHAQTMLDDIPNYTDIQPTIQISQIIV